MATRIDRVELTERFELLLVQLHLSEGLKPGKSGMAAGRVEG